MMEHSIAGSCAICIADVLGRNDNFLSAPFHALYALDVLQRFSNF